MKHLSRFQRRGIGVGFLALSLLASAPSTADAQSALPSKSTRIDADGTSHVANLSFPPSDFASDQAKAAFVEEQAQVMSSLPPLTDIGAVRSFFDTRNRRIVAKMRETYRVKIHEQTIGGVPVEVIVPEGGPSAKNANRVLINLHGGGFMFGEGAGGEVESIPIASLGKITVITVAYRMAPEHRFPAATEDVAAVFRALLAKHRPGQIGIYGCSAGGILTAQTVAWLAKHQMPVPGAIGTFCGSAAPVSGDTMAIMPWLTGLDVPAQPSWPYLAGVKPDDALAYPTNSTDLLKRFPPTLLLAGSRDFTLSSLFYTQRRLTVAGVEAELHVWDGLPHAFFTNPDLPESRELYEVVVRFFDRHLAK